MNEQAPQQKQIDIQIPPEVEPGHYSNLGLLSHNEGEFIFDFIFLPPQKQSAKVVSRVILSPQHAKRFLGALADNLKRYESVFGEIRLGKEERKIGF